MERERVCQVTVVYSVYLMCVLITVHGQNPSPGVVIMILCLCAHKKASLYFIPMCECSPSMHMHIEE